MKNSFKVSYVTTLPKQGNAPQVTITGSVDKKYTVKFIDYDTKEVFSGTCRNNQTIVCGMKQYFTNWMIQVIDGDDYVFEDKFNPYGRTIFIKMDSYALGDSVAWMPYVEVFRKKHNCRVICSTFHNNVFVESYPEILFVKPNTVIENIYAQYYIGAANDGNLRYSPIKVDEHPLQDVAARILGLKPMEIRPRLDDFIKRFPRRIAEKYVTLSEFGSAENKQWKGDWQKVVDYFNEKGYKVAVISKEPTKLKNVMDLTGAWPIEERMLDMAHAEMHLGVSSGLSWLAWAVGTHVVLISDVTPKFHEFSTNVTRLCANDLTAVNYLAEGQTKVEEVIKKLVELGVS